MTWVVYDKETAKIVKTFYLKQKAKDFVKYSYWSGADRRRVAIDKVDIVRLEEWKMWKALQLKYRP
jgi:hypothetical protein